MVKEKVNYKRAYISNDLHKLIKEFQANLNRAEKYKKKRRKNYNFIEASEKLAKYLNTLK